MVVEELRSRGGRPAGRNRVAAPGIPAGTTKYLYYSSQWQVVEERWNGTAASNVQYQYVWSAAYVNGTVLRDTYLAGAVQPDLRLYTATDANYNVTALVGYDPATQTWGVVERFVYSPYGTVTVLSPAWTVQADAFNWQYLYQGGRQDAATGLYLFQHRNYSPSLGTWTSQDPLQYINGANTYQFVMGNPVGRTDLWGDFWGLMNLMQYDAPDPAKFLPIAGANFRINVMGSSRNSVHANITLNLPASAHNGALKCSRIKFVQFIKDGIIWKTLGELSGSTNIGARPWEVDSNCPFNYLVVASTGSGQMWPFYPYQTVWHGLRPSENSAFMHDTPSASGWLSTPQQRRFEARDVAIVDGGVDDGRYVGAIYWGFYMDWTGRTYERVWWGMPRHVASGPTWGNILANPWNNGPAPWRSPPVVRGQAVPPQE